MTRTRIMEMMKPEWWLTQKEKIGGLTPLLDMVKTMTETIQSMQVGQFIDVKNVKEQNRELFYVVAATYMIGNTGYIFSNNYERLYRTKVDRNGFTILESSYR